MTAHTVEIVIRGTLGFSLIAALDGFAVLHDPSGTTAITGDVPDQAKLFGILEMFDGLHIEVVSVNRIDHLTLTPTDAPDVAGS